MPISHSKCLFRRATYHMAKLPGEAGRAKRKASPPTGINARKKSKEKSSASRARQCLTSYKALTELGIDLNTIQAKSKQHKNIIHEDYYKFTEAWSLPCAPDNFIEVPARTVVHERHAGTKPDNSLESGRRGTRIRHPRGDKRRAMQTGFAKRLQNALLPIDEVAINVHLQGYNHTQKPAAQGTITHNTSRQIVHTSVRERAMESVQRKRTKLFLQKTKKNKQ
jgi:hypothetical protein